MFKQNSKFKDPKAGCTSNVQKKTGRMVSVDGAERARGDLSERASGVTTHQTVFSHEIEQNHAIWSNMDGPRDCHNE